MAGHGLRRARYGEWLAYNGLRFNFASEIASLATNTTAGVMNDTPPLESWHLIVPTSRIVELAREMFGAVTINSAYRSPAYNEAVGGAKHSRHAQNDALDFRCATGTPEQWAAFLRDQRRAGKFRGGIGTYSRFVHVDTRGTNTDWDG